MIKLKNKKKKYNWKKYDLSHAVGLNRRIKLSNSFPIRTRCSYCLTPLKEYSSFWGNEIIKEPIKMQKIFVHNSKYDKFYDNHYKWQNENAFIIKNTSEFRYHLYYTKFPIKAFKENNSNEYEEEYHCKCGKTRYIVNYIKNFNKPEITLKQAGKYYDKL